MKSEPTAIIESLRFVAIVAGMFGVVITAEEQAVLAAAIGGVLAAVSIGLAILNRLSVFSPKKVQEIADNATHLPAGTHVDIGNPPEGPPGGG